MLEIVKLDWKSRLFSIEAKNFQSNSTKFDCISVMTFMSQHERETLASVAAGMRGYVE